MILENKSIVITGGTSGIGLALVNELAPANKVYVISKQGRLPQEICEHHKVQLFHADLSNKTELEIVTDQLLKQQSSIDLLFNNAAIQNLPEYLDDDFNYDGIQREIDTNFTAICRLTYLLMPALLEGDGGQIVNINSGLAIVPKRASAIYCATKSALDSFSKSLSYQLEDTRVGVSQVFLPLVETRMTVGRGKQKLEPDCVAQEICKAVQKGRQVIDIGKVRLLRVLNALTPSLANHIMKRS